MFQFTAFKQGPLTGLKDIMRFFSWLHGCAYQNETLLSYSTSMSSMPNHLSVPVHFLDAMQRNGMGFAFAVIPLKNTVAAFWKFDIGKRLHHKAIFDTVVIADPEFRAAELFVPAYAIEQVLNGHHD
jgi:hypothetical protein